MPAWCPRSGLWEAFCMLSHDWEMRKSHHDRPSTLAASTFMTVGLVSTAQTCTSTNTRIIRPSFLESTVPLADSTLNNSSHSAPQQTRRFQTACEPVSKTMERVELIEVISQAVNGKDIGEAREGKNLFHYLIDRLCTQNSKHYGVSSLLCQDIITLTTFFFSLGQNRGFFFTPLLYTDAGAHSRVWDGNAPWMGGQFISGQPAHTQSQNQSQLGSVYHSHSICCHVFKSWEETRKLTGSNSSPGSNQQSWSCEAWHAAMLMKEVINGIIKTQTIHLFWLHIQKEVTGWDNYILGYFRVIS